MQNQLGIQHLNGDFGSWTDLHVDLRLKAPYPANLLISVWGDRDEGDEDDNANAPYFGVYIMRLDRTELWHVETSSNQIDDSFFSAVYEALDRISDEPECWTDDALDKAFEIFCNIEVGVDGDLHDGFLHFDAGTNYEHVHDWFDHLHSKGVAFLLNPEGACPSMSESEMREALKQLLDAYIELSERYCCPHASIVESLTEIFEDDQLRWLGYRQFISDTAASKHTSPRKSIADMMAEDLIGSEENLSVVTDIVPDKRNDNRSDKRKGSKRTSEPPKSDVIDPDGQCLSCNYLNNFKEGTGKCKNCVNHGGTKNNFVGASSCEIVLGPCHECRECKNWYIKSSFLSELDSFVNKMIARFFSEEAPGSMVVLPDGSRRYEVAPRFDHEFSQEQIQDILQAGNQVEAITRAVSTVYRKDIQEMTASIEDYVLFEVNKKWFLYRPDSNGMLPDFIHDTVTAQIHKLISFTVPVSYYEALAKGEPWFKVGDKVRIQYNSDRNPHNGKIGTITWLHDHKYYPNRDYSVVVMQTQAQILYPDGTAEMVDNIYRAGSGTFSPVEKIQS